MPQIASRPFHLLINATAMLINATAMVVIEWEAIAAMFDWFIQHDADPNLAYGKDHSPIDALCDVVKLRPMSYGRPHTTQIPCRPQPHFD